MKGGYKMTAKELYEYCKSEGVENLPLEIWAIVGKNNKYGDESIAKVSFWAKSLEVQYDDERIFLVVGD